MWVRQWATGTNPTDDNLWVNYTCHSLSWFVVNQKVTRPHECHLLPKTHTYHTLYTSNYIPNGYLIRKAIYEQIEPFTPDAPLEDWFLMLQISKYSKMKYIDEVLFSYRWHDSNTIKNKEKVRFLLKKTREYEEYILQHLEKSKVKKDVIEIIEKENMS